MDLPCLRIQGGDLDDSVNYTRLLDCGTVSEGPKEVKEQEGKEEVYKRTRKNRNIDRNRDEGKDM